MLAFIGITLAFILPSPAHQMMPSSYPLNGFGNSFGMGSNFNGMGSNFNGMSSNFNGMGSSFNGMGSSFNGMGSQLNGLSNNLYGFRSGFNGMESNLNGFSYNNNGLGNNYHSLRKSGTKHSEFQEDPSDEIYDDGKPKDEITEAIERAYKAKCPHKHKEASSETPDEPKQEYLNIVPIMYKANKLIFVPRPVMVPNIAYVKIPTQENATISINKRLLFPNRPANNNNSHPDVHPYDNRHPDNYPHDNRHPDNHPNNNRHPDNKDHHDSKPHIPPHGPDRPNKIYDHNDHFEILSKEHPGGSREPNEFDYDSEQINEKCTSVAQCKNRYFKDVAKVRRHRAASGANNKTKPKDPYTKIVARVASRKLEALRTTPQRDANAASNKQVFYRKTLNLYLPHFEKYHQTTDQGRDTKAPPRR